MRPRWARLDPLSIALPPTGCGFSAGGGGWAGYLGRSPARAARVAIKVSGPTIARGSRCRRRSRSRRSAAVGAVNPCFTAAVVRPIQRAGRAWVAPRTSTGRAWRPGFARDRNRSRRRGADGAATSLAEDDSRRSTGPHGAPRFSPATSFVKTSGPAIIGLRYALAADVDQRDQPAVTRAPRLHSHRERIHGSEAERPAMLLPRRATLVYAATGKTWSTRDRSTHSGCRSRPAV